MSFAGDIVSDPPQRQAESCGAARTNDDLVSDRLDMTDLCFIRSSRLSRLQAWLPAWPEQGKSSNRAAAPL